MKFGVSGYEFIARYFVVVKGNIEQEIAVGYGVVKIQATVLRHGGEEGRTSSRRNMA